VRVSYRVDDDPAWRHYQIYPASVPGGEGPPIPITPGWHTISIKCHGRDGTIEISKRVNVKTKGNGEPEGAVGVLGPLVGGAVAVGVLSALVYVLYGHLVPLDRLRRVGKTGPKKLLPTKTGIIERLLPEGGKVTSPFGLHRVYRKGAFHQGLTDEFRKGEEVFTKKYKEEIGKELTIREHKGMDIYTPVGKPLLAGVLGTVERVNLGSKGPGGRFIEIRTRDGYLIRYLHLDRVLVREGEPINDVFKEIAKTGMTGGVSPHLHLEARAPKTNLPIDPLDYFTKTP
jgi:murein DD-endopeptidase MepM/ murein hydrolase activator NlpD